MPTVLEETPSMIDNISAIFTGAATQMGGMMVPVLTAGVAVAIGILAFTIGKKLLKKSENTIAEIANMVGYQDVKYFSKTFKSIYGVKPTEYKKMLASLHAHNLNI